MLGPSRLVLPILKTLELEAGKQQIACIEGCLQLDPAYRSTAERVREQCDRPRFESIEFQSQSEDKHAKHRQNEASAGEASPKEMPVVQNSRLKAAASAMRKGATGVISPGLRAGALPPGTLGPATASATKGPLGLPDGAEHVQ